MGRKPNALILQYFYRGAKLEDASNRYQHTCKACGEVFPKGRIDSLQNHITKKCTALDHPEKTKILLQFHNSPSSSSASKAEKKAKEHRTTNIPAQHLHTPQQAFDGLNVLAEASRQVGPVETRASHIQTYPPTSNDYHPATSGGGDPMNIAIDPSLDAFTNPFDDLGTLPHHHGESNSYGFPDDSDYAQGHTNAIADLPSLAPLTADETDDDHMHEHNIGGGPGEGLDIHGSTQQDKDLSTIAADANELLPQHLPQHVGEGQQADEDKDLPDAAAAAGNGREIVDTDGRPNGVETEAALVPDRDVEIIGNENAQQNIGNNRSSDQWQLNLDGPNFQAFYEEMQKAENGQSQAQPLASVPRPIAIREHDNEGEFTEFRASPNQGRRQIARQRFTAERRREVQDVRKMGACLRCRMLRKPCSPESPCGTCRSVDSARVWKEPCMRVRIPDLFDLYTAGLHTSLAYRDTTLVKSQLQFEHSHGQIQVTHFDEPAIGISFKALEGRIDAAAVGVQLLASENVSLAAQDVRLIDGEGDDLVVKMSSYLQAFGRALQENEPSHFMRSTLAATSDMYEESKVRPLLLPHGCMLMILGRPLEGHLGALDCNPCSLRSRNPMEDFSCLHDHPRNYCH